MATRLLRVLVVDPSEDTADSLGMMLRLWGYDVQVAYTGHEALKIAAYHRPHAVLMEPAPAELDAAEIVARLRGTAILVAVTTQDDLKHRQQCTEAGFSFMAVKPVVAESLQVLLDALDKGLLARTNGDGVRPKLPENSTDAAP